jgi:NitT/TauT family transport system substrate-binding protein
MGKIVLYENMRAIPYLPFYLAHAQDAFSAEGIELELQLSPSTTETAQGLLEGRADVAWGGPMRVMMHHDANPQCPLVCFCHVVARDPFLLIGRKPNSDFRFSDLMGLRIGVASEVPTPEMTFQDDLRRAGLDPFTLEWGTDFAMEENVAALREGRIDVIQVFEPYADDLIENGDGHLWHRFSSRGEIGYTTFYTTRQFVDSHWETCVGLTRAMSRVQKWLRRHSGAEAAKAVSRYFPNLTHKRLTRIIESYRVAGLWAESPELPVAAFVRLKAALLSGGLIGYDVPYQRVVVADLSDASI